MIANGQVAQKEAGALPASGRSNWVVDGSLQKTAGAGGSWAAEDPGMGVTKRHRMAMSVRKTPW